MHSTLLNAEGKFYRGFLVTKHLPLPELKATLIELVHEETGAEVMQIACDDAENLFALCFQTLPDSSNGVAHVLEHTVLCGSQKFPVKDPFFAMSRRSLNTYMNALTGSDFTAYPASSQVEQDFTNLLTVYLDAVFHPLLRRTSFAQEGHHFCFSVPEDINSPLQIKGVVYNEMKGAMSSTDERFSLSMLKHLVPDLPYAYNSGGDPREIPALSYEELVEFHRNYYHPSRCLFFFYGNIPLERHLDFIATHAFQGVTPQEPIPPLPLQKRFTAPWHVEESYGISPQENKTKKTIIGIGLLTVPISHQEELLALSLLDSLLMDTDASPLKLALLQSKLCTSADSIFDTEMSEVPWILMCKGCEEADRKPLIQLFRTTLKRIAQEGFSKESVNASLHQLEFERSEIGGSSLPFGLTLFFRSALIKQHGAAPESALLIHTLFQKLRDQLADPSYLPSLIRRHFLENNHVVYLTLKPDPELLQREETEEQRSLTLLKEGLSKEQLHTLVEQEKQLEKEREEIERQSVDCLPLISLSDIPKHAQNFDLSSREEAHFTLHHHSCFTNKIVYADLLFDLPEIALDDLPLLSLFIRLWTEVGSGGRSYIETIEWQQAHLGDCSASLSLYISDESEQLCTPAFSLRAKVLEHNRKYLLPFFLDSSESLNWNDKGRVQELLAESATEQEHRITKNALNYAQLLAASGRSSPALMLHRLQGIPYFDFVKNRAQKKIEETISDLERMNQQLCKALHPHLICSCDNIPFSEKEISSFSQKLSQNAPLPWKNQYTPSSVASQGLIIASPVAYSAFVLPTIAMSHPESPALMVATALMEHLVLHREIREQGGAYGSGATYSPNMGQFSFYAYRDPHIASSYESFLRAIERISQQKFNDRELFEAKLDILQKLDAPIPPRQRAMSAFGWMRTKRTFAKRDAWRQAIIQLSADAVATAVARHLSPEQGTLVTLAGEDLLRRDAPKIELKILPFLQ